MKKKSLRFNNDKPKWSLVHYKSLLPLVRQLEAGAAKYAPNNWMIDLNEREILDCLQRHLAALMDGEKYDPDTGVHHIGAIMCNAMFYSFHYVKNPISKKIKNWPKWLQKIKKKYKNQSS